MERCGGGGIWKQMPGIKSNISKKVTGIGKHWEKNRDWSEKWCFNLRMWKKMHKPGVIYTTEPKVSQFQFQIQEYTNVNNGDMNTGTQARRVQATSLYTTARWEWKSQRL
jgi:hypothetical protein